jgi:hypothetical protein
MMTNQINDFFLDAFLVRPTTKPNPNTNKDIIDNDVLFPNKICQNKTKHLLGK